MKFDARSIAKVVQTFAGNSNGNAVSPTQFNSFDTLDFLSVLITFAHQSVQNIGDPVTNPYIMQMHDSDDDISFALVSTDNLIGSNEILVDGASGPAIHQLGYVGNKRYVRMTFFPPSSNQSASVAMFGNAVLARPIKASVTNFGV